MDGDTETHRARRVPFAWRRPALGVAVGLGLALSPDTMLHDAAATTVQASPLAASADLRVTLGGSEWRVAPNEGFSYRVTVANLGSAPVSALVETVLHPALGNVTVAASGFSCARQFEAAGSQPGTAVTCTSWEPLEPGESASITVQARAAASPGKYRIVASATEDGERDEDSRTSADLRVGP